MDPASATPAHDDQQVMHAQTAQPTPRHTGQLLMEGEVAGPNYEGTSRPRPAVSLPLPNGVPPAAVQRPSVDGVEMDSLNGSPWATGMAYAPDQGESARPAFFSEAWSGFNIRQGPPRLNIVVVWLRILFQLRLVMGQEGEVVQEEVRRQVQEALESQRRFMIFVMFVRPTLSTMVRHSGRSNLEAPTMAKEFHLSAAASRPVKSGRAPLPMPEYLEQIQLVFTEVLEYHRGIGRMTQRLASEYLEQILLVFKEVLEYHLGIGLMTQRLASEYLEQILLVFKEVLEYHLGIGLMIQRQALEYLGQILLVFKEVLEYHLGIGLMIQSQASEYLGQILPVFKEVLEYHLGIGLMCKSLALDFVEVMVTFQALDREVVLGLCLKDCVAMKIEVLVEAPGRRVWRGTGSGPEFVDGGLGVPPVDLAYRPPGYKDSQTYGDYGFERPPGLELQTEGPAVPNQTPHPAAPTPAGGTAPSSGEPAGPSPIDVLITGMSQLQQVLLKQKSDVMDLEPKAVSELVKLPEYTAETGAIDFQDYLYLAEQQIGTLASGAGDWWARTLRAAQVAYAEYQTLSPVRKVAALVLASLPKGVRDDLVAYRVQGVHQILYRLMVIFQPGGAQDRAQLLRQLDVTESAAGPAEATAAIRRWYRLLQRASDLGVTLPDESLQVKSLSVIVKKTSEQNADFKFRLALARTELQIDTRPTQENVMRYLQHLLAELEQLGAIARKSQTGTTTRASTTTAPTSSTTTPTGAGGASLKGLQPAPEAKAKPKAGPGKKVCSWFSSDAGCRNGKNCTFQHQWSGLNRGERCLLCGSKQHRAKDCTAGGTAIPADKGQQAARVAKVQAGTSATTPAPPTGTATTAMEPAMEPSSTSSASPPASGGAHNKIDAARVTEILTETNKMLKSLATQQASGAGQAPAPLDPLEMIQKQLDEVRRLKVMVVRNPAEDTSAFTSALSWYETRLSSSTVIGGGDVEEEEALLDSGASHAYRPPISASELEGARRVGVSLATGEERAIPQNPGGTLLMENSGDGTILPMGQLVQLLGCRVSWEPNKLTVIHPVHGRLRVRLRGHCPVLPVTQALELIAELEQKRMASFERTVKELQQQIKVIKEKGLQSWTWREHLRAAREGGDRTHVAGFLHKNPVFSTVNAEALLGVPEHVPLGGRDGWKLLKGEVPLVMNEKKVVLGGNLDLWHLRGLKVGVDATLGSVWPLELVANIALAVRAWVGLRNHEGLLSSLRRSSWLDGGDPVELNKFDVKDWKLHLQRDHLPYRKDCRTCIERASGKPHRRISHPSACCLSIDTAGPFRNVGAGGYKYLLVGCYRHPKLPGTKPEEESAEPPKPEGVVPCPDDGDDWLEDAGPDCDEEPPVEEPEGGVGFIDPGEPVDREVEELKELAEPLEFVSIYVARPMRSRKKAETLKAIQELYIQLRSAGFPLARLHMDRAREYQSSALEHWAAARDIELSRTQGDDPSQNGTAERAVGYVKMRVRVLLSQAKELSGVSDDVIRTWWPLAAETAVSQHQAMAMGRKFPSAARFGSRVFTRRKGYGAGRPDLKPKWIGGVYLGPARSVPGGHMVYTDEGNLWFSTNIRQFEDRAADGDEDRKAESSPPDLLPARRVTGKTSAVELANGASLLPGAADGSGGVRPEGALRSVVALSPGSDSDADDESWTVVSDGAQLCDLEVPESSSPSTTTSNRSRGSLAAEYVESGCYSMDECLRVLESEPFLKTKKQRTTAWKENGPPPIHTTLGAYQRGPYVGVTNATRRHCSLALYLTEFLKRHCGEQCEFTSLTVARDLNTEVHSDRFNLRNSTNYVLTLGNFQGGGVWVEGEATDFAKVAVESSPGEILQGHVLPVHNRIVQINPKKLHRTMPWSGGPKWTVIAHTIGARKKLSSDDVEGLKGLGFPMPSASLCALSPEGPGPGGEFPCGTPWRFMLSQLELEEEMMSRLWTRRVLDEEEQLANVVPNDLVTEYEGVSQANIEAATNLHFRETRCVHERWNEEQWLGLCRMTESEEETFGVETMLEELKEPLKVVFTVALDEVKNYASRWSEAMHKEVKALLDAGALVPLSAEEQARLEASGKLVVLPAKGVFTAKPPDVERSHDDEGNPLPQGSIHYVKRKARLVICGNFQGRQAREDSYAGGCQIDSLRAMLVFAALKRWHFASTDIRNAFILAPIKEEEEEDDGTVYGLFPPRVFQLVAVPYCYQLWRVDRALYGFRRSPRLWSKFRDRRLRGAKVAYGQGFLVLRQSRADTNVWSIVYEVDGAEPEIKGYLNIYVDDVLYVGIAEVIEVVQSWLTSEWKASDLTWASEGSGSWLLGECDESPVDYTAEQLKRAQTLTGELLWLSGRSRPDIMHSVCTMSSLCVKNPELVERIGYRVLGYLKATAGVCLWYKPCEAAYEVLGYSDASFAPSGSRSVGCSVACYYGCPVSWRCGRQSLVALSVAEAELLEAVNCVQLMSGLESFVEELQPTAPRLCLRVDNQAAVGLTTEAAGTWKTRHLRVRAFALREAVRVETLKIQHVEGLKQLGDLGTKCFHKPRLEQLRELWGLRTDESTFETEESNNPRPKASIATLAMNGVAGVLARLTLILGWLVRGSTASDSEPGGGLELSFAWELYGLAILAVISAIGVWELLKWLLSRCCGSGELHESREARRLRKLQQVVHEEVGRYGLEVGVKVSSASSPAATASSTSSRVEDRATTLRPKLVTRGSQTEPYDAGMRQHAGPFFASEQGGRIHHDPNCRGLRNAVHRTRRLTLCAYCYQRCPLYIPDD
ncbi:unnamed protein product [Symbiodinium sp. CCMP2592]|nr:unnamed protein product [Symbiodinium sp. CCMP2592]